MTQPTPDLPGRRSPEFGAYWNAMYRCTHPSAPRYRHYGGRGIEFRFSSFGEFYAEVGPRPSNKHSIDRINNDGHYEIGNVRWATQKQQVANSRPRKCKPRRLVPITKKEIAVRNRLRLQRTDRVCGQCKERFARINHWLCPPCERVYNQKRRERLRQQKQERLNGLT